MKKIFVLSLGLFFALPFSTHAQITSLNGLTTAIQQLVSPGSNATNTMHMEIIPVGTDRHRFRWDGTPWRVEQGGTGASMFNQGNILFGDGTNPIATDSALSWDSVTRFLTMSSDPDAIDPPFLTGIHTPSATIPERPGISFELRAGNGMGVHGGHIDIVAGNNDGELGIGGDVTIWGGDTASNERAGDIVLTTGNSILGTGAAGALRIITGSDAGGGMGVIEVISGPISINSPNFKLGGSATTTIDFGEIGNSSSRACFNTKNTDGGDISFYFVGTSMVVENNLCQ